MAKKERIKGWKKEPGKKPYRIDISNELQALQRQVGGYIETVTEGDAVIICDEEGRLKNLPYNCKIFGIHGEIASFCGTILFFGVDADEGEFTDCPREDIGSFGPKETRVYLT
ncbi:MAG: DUF3846 domain-containing protein [Bacilli bacterium]|nr:DUF3846 domain-containing protein [Bacilli bacterium]